MPKKRLFARILDYFLTMVGSIIIFVIVNIIAFNIPTVKNISKKLSELSMSSATYVESSGIQRLNEDRNGLVSIDTMGNEYIVNVTKTSACYHDLDYSYKNEDGTYTDKKVTIEETFFHNPQDYELDNISFFFKKFKVNEPGLEYEEGVDINQYLYIDVMKLTASNYISSDETNYQQYKEYVSNYVILNLESTQKMIRRVARGETIDSIAVAIYDEIYNGYVSAVKVGIDDIENRSIAFLNITNEFNKTYQKISSVIAIDFYISILVAYIILMFIGRLASKEWITIGQKAFKLGISDKNEMEPSFIRMMVYHLISFVLFTSTSIFSMMLTGMFGIMAINVLPHISLLVINLLIIILNITSIIMCLANKKNHHDLSSFIAGLLIKDSMEFDTKVEEVDAYKTI